MARFREWDLQTMALQELRGKVLAFSLVRKWLRDTKVWLRRARQQI